MGELGVTYNPDIFKENMVDEKHNFHLLSSLVCGISSDILVRFLDKKLEIANSCLPTFLLAERHTFYHLLEESECCACTANKRSYKTGMFNNKKQWDDLYSSNRLPCSNCTNCSCQYDVQANVRSSELDISLCSILLLNSGLLNVIKSEICHINRIRKHRNDLAHNTSSEIDNYSFQMMWNDMAVSVMQLARACSIELAEQTEKKLYTAKTPQQSYIETPMICDECPQCMISPEHESEKRMKVCTSISAVQEAIERMNACLIHMLQQKGAYDFKQMKAILMTDKFKEYIISNLDANLVIEVLKIKEIFSNSDVQLVDDLEEMKKRSEKMLQAMLSKDVTVVDEFMHSLLETHHTLMHNFIQRTDCWNKLGMIFECNVPQPHEVDVDMSVHISFKDCSEVESKVLAILQQKAEEINQLTLEFSNMALRDIREGSIIIRLKPEDPNAIKKFYNAYLNGKLHDLIEEILRRSGVLDELIRDQVTVVVKISTDGPRIEPSTFYERNWKFLVEELSPRSVAALLQERGILSEDDIKEIFHADNLTRFSQSNSLLRNLNSKNIETVVDFKQCLALSSQGYILRNVIDIVAADGNQVEQASSSQNGLDRVSNNENNYRQVTITVSDDKDEDDSL